MSFENSGKHDDDHDDTFKKVNDSLYLPHYSQQSSLKRKLPEDTRISRPFWPITPYLDEDAQQALKEYKYSAEDRQYCYVYCFNPLSKKIASMTPKFIAPNLITLAGWVFSVGPWLILFGLYGPAMSADPKYPIPGAYFFGQAICYFIYRILDEVDGKHARNINNSSPLGLFFDHGVDAFSVGIQGMIHARTMQFGNCIFAFAGLAAISAVFHTITADEYYTGVLILQECNGVTDLSFILYGVLIIAGIFGSEVFGKDLYMGWSAGNLINLFITVSQFSTIIFTMKGIRDYQRREHGPDAPMGEWLRKKDWPKQVLAYALFLATIMGFLLVCEFPLWADPLKEDRSKHALFFQILGLHVIISTHLTVSIQFAHVTKRKYEPLFGNRLLCFVLSAGVAVQLIHALLTYVEKDKQEKLQFLRISISLILYTSMFCFIHFIVNVINEMADSLKIPVFLVKKQPKDQDNKPESQQQLL